jgi:hypothetical protein
MIRPDAAVCVQAKTGIASCFVRVVEDVYMLALNTKTTSRRAGAREFVKCPALCEIVTFPPVATVVLAATFFPPIRNGKFWINGRDFATVANSCTVPGWARLWKNIA